MENNDKVFVSKISRVFIKPKNNLYDLLKVEPAKPVKLNDVKIGHCDFTPKTGKYYIPKKRSKLKVRTLRDIRKSFEEEVYRYLITDLETQENILLNKIRHGASRDDDTKEFATALLRGDEPISRLIRQMLINLNPENQKHARQFVLYNGKSIQVNGSFGGKKKYICDYDLADKPHCKHPTKSYKKEFLKPLEGNKKKGLLRSSLAVNFKPGPLCKKRFLDDSHQKYHVGNIELINLPKLGLDVQPEYGTAFEPPITHFFNHLREEDGTISRKLAELAVSVLGSVQNSKAVQINRDCVTLDLAYKHNQNRLLMRRDVDHCCNISEVVDTGALFTNLGTIEKNELLEIEDVVHKIIDAVEISLTQDTIFTQDQDLKTFPCEELESVSNVTHVKDKSKKKYGELDRLDVTVITLPDTEERNLTKSCSKMYCSFGCICASLEGTYNVKEHCGHVKCMFECKCDFTKNKSDLSYTGCTEQFPGLVSVENKINSSLAKEEQKFHQTVIVTGEETILLKGERRNGKTSKQYSDYKTNMRFKQENQKTQNLSIVAFKLNCDNIEPWCMVHELYKCFCKGKFTETYVSVSNDALGKEPLTKDSISKDCLENSKVTNDISDIEECERRESTNSVKKFKISDNANTKINKIHTSRSMDKTINTNKIPVKLINSDPAKKNQMSSILTEDIGTVLKDSSDIINMKAEKGIRTRHTVRKSCIQQHSNNENKFDSEDSDYLKFWDNKSTSSSRTTAYEGRKYSNGYYKNTNYKILTMEKNDKRLQDRLAFLSSKCCEKGTIIKPRLATKDTIIKPSSATKDTIIKPTSTIKDTIIEPTCTIKNTIIESAGTTIESARLLQLLCDNNENDEDLAPKSKRRRLLNDTNLVTWLESNYKLYRQRNDTSLFKNGLQAPQHGKVALHSWDFILERYRERKNHFFVSRKPPFRIFMAINSQNPFFENYIDINDIRFADLHKFPTTVKNLLINATELKENFCILRGFSFCWELIGSVTKVSERIEHAGQEDTPEINLESYDMDMLAVFNANNSELRQSVVKNTKQNEIETVDICNQGSSEVNNLLFENTEIITAFNHNLEIRDSFIDNMPQTDLDQIDTFNQNNSALKTSLIENMEQKDNISSSEEEFESSTGCSDDTGSSKWFVMTVENDFSEIRFFRKGFFVTYQCIINAISVARLSGKTVRMSSKICIEQPKGPQFGIYAVPNDNEYCVFVGPYEMEDTLGIETIKTILDVRRLKRTRGFWITTNKADNSKVVENPLSFVALTNSQINSLPLETHFNANDEVNKYQQENRDLQETLHINKTKESEESSPPQKGQIKIVKPIKIRKTNGFYHLASGGVLKKMLKYPQSTTKATPVVLNTSLNMEDNGAKSLLEPLGISNDLNLNQIPEISQELFAEPSSSAASQIKISAVYSTQNSDPIANHTNNDGDIVHNITHTKSPTSAPRATSMFILKPEEINRRLVQNKSEPKLCNLNDDVYVISDDENCTTSDTPVNFNIWTDVWIECINIPNLGWIAGIKNLNNLLSFKILGCEYSEFYPEEVAFTKINSELHKRNNRLNDLELQWTVHESVNLLQGQELNPDHLYPDCIPSPEERLHTSEIIKRNKGNLKTYSKKQRKAKAVG